MPPIIEVNELSFKYATAKVPALKNVSFSIDKGEFVCITGPSGCGKSTLALALAGFIPHMYRGTMKGNILVDGHNTRILPSGFLSGTVGLVQQDPEAQLCTLKVVDEVAFGPENLCLPQEKLQGRVKWALDAAGATSLRHRNVYSLSGGEKQRVAIASVLAMTPKVLILDEPTANLDPGATARILSIIQSLRLKHDMAIIVIEHRLDKLLPYTNRLITIDQGSIIEDSPPGKNPYLKVCNPNHEPNTNNSIDNRDGKHDITRNNAKSQVPIKQTKPMLSVSNITVNYDKYKALDNVSFELYPGEIVAVMGDNGSGKTTLLSALLGLVELSEGTIELCSKDISDQRIAERARKMGLSFQNPNHQITENTVWEEAHLPRLNFKPHDKSDSNAGINPGGKQNHEQKKQPEPDISQLLIDFGLSEYRSKNPFALSHGQKKRLNLTSLLGYSPRVLLLDEPMVGQDPVSQSIIVDKLRKFSGNGGLVIMVCHEPATIAKCCHRILFFEKGKLLLDESVNKAFSRLKQMGRTEYLPPDRSSSYIAGQAMPDSTESNYKPSEVPQHICDTCNKHKHDTLGHYTKGSQNNYGTQEIKDAHTKAGSAKPATLSDSGGLFGLGYVPGQSLLHKVNPLAKITLLVAFTIAVFTVGFVPWQAFLFLFMFLGYGLAGLGPGFFVRKMRMILRFCFLIFLVQVLFWHEGHIVWFFNIAGLRISIWSEGIIRGVGISLRFLNVVGSSYLFISTTDPNQMAYSLMQAGLPYRYGFMIITSLRFIPLFNLELTQIRNAQMAKGIDLQDKSVRGLVKQVRYTFLPLIVSALEKVDSLTMSMEGRAFGLYPTRTYRVTHRITGTDALFLAVSLAILVCLIAASLISV